MKNTNNHIWLRTETKAFERRTPLTPADAAKLLAQGTRVTVESSEDRVYSDDQFSQVGCEIAQAGDWRKAPKECFILGLKELPSESFELSHKHIYFAHAYKKQLGWEALLSRFNHGGGTLLDLEFLVDDSSRRVAAFGHWAGFAGAALAVDIWAHQMAAPELEFPPVHSVTDQSELVSAISRRLNEAISVTNSLPKVMVLGAKGRSGRGALDLLAKLGFKDSISQWDLAETRKGGPFPEILEHDILVNCVLVQGLMAPFLTPSMIAGNRKLSVISDVSCDPNSPHNPLPIYESTTSFQNPSVRLRHANEFANALDLTAIDHLPSLLPNESSDDFSAQLVPHLEALGSGSAVWSRAETLFLSKLREVPPERDSFAQVSL